MLCACVADTLDGLVGTVSNSPELAPPMYVYNKSSPQRMPYTYIEQLSAFGSLHQHLPGSANLCNKLATVPIMKKY